MPGLWFPRWLLARLALPNTETEDQVSSPWARGHCFLPHCLHIKHCPRHNGPRHGVQFSFLRFISWKITWWDYFKCPKSWAQTKQTSCYVETKYYFHIKYVGNQFRYIAREEYNCHQNQKWQIVLIEGLFRVAVRGIDHQQLLTEVVISNLTQAENYIFLLISFHCWRKI